MIQLIQTYLPNVYKLGWSGQYGWGTAIYLTLYMTVISFIIGGFLGLLFAILLFTFGLFKMLVVALFVLVGVAIGQIFDGKATILAKIRSLFTDKN